jgi:hypothetical protein
MWSLVVVAVVVRITQQTPVALAALVAVKHIGRLPKPLRFLLAPVRLAKEITGQQAATRAAVAAAVLVLLVLLALRMWVEMAVLVFLHPSTALRPQGLVAVAVGQAAQVLALAGLVVEAMVELMAQEPLEQPTQEAVAAVLVKTILAAQQAVQALSSFATSLVLRALQPLLQQAARLQTSPLAGQTTRFTRSPPAARLTS